MSNAKVLAFSGSTREESFNQRLASYAAGKARLAGADVTLINLRDYPMPLMDQDLERDQGQPEHAGRLKQLMAEHDGFLIASPEYNGSISPLLKNALDWASRRTGDEPSMMAYKGKTVALMSASPGRLGGLRGLVPVRQLLSNLGALALPGQASIGAAFTAFDDAGQLVNEHDVKSVDSLVSAFVTLLGQLGRS
jgi:NAD(P)H-dependent FMN reductase